MVFESKGAMTATAVVAARDSLNVAAGNYVCAVGVNDDVTIQEALDAGYGEVVLLEGNFTTQANLIVPDDTKLRGMGKGTIITPTGAAIGGAPSRGSIELGNRSALMDMKIILAAGAGAANTRPNVVMADTKTLVWIENCWIVGDTSVEDDASNNRQCGILFDTVTESKVITCRSEDNDRQGILLYNSSNNNTLTGNTCQGNYWIGIFLFDSCNNNTVTGNTFQGNIQVGIRSWGSSNNTLTGNTIQGNTRDGIYMTNCSNNTITGNTCQGNTRNGIHMDTSSNNTITGNTIQGNTEDGIILTSSLNNTLTGNTVADNGYHGIFISESSQNVVTGNQCDDNGAAATYHGIYIYRSSYCTVKGNVCVNNLIDGINVTGDAGAAASYNSIVGNTCTGNGDDGVEVAGAAFAVKNIVLGNNLLGNTGANLVDGGNNSEIGHNVTV